MASIKKQLAELNHLMPEALLKDRMAARREIGRLRSLAGQTSSLDAFQKRYARLYEQIEQSANLRRLRSEQVPHLTFDPDLPICGRKEDLVTAIKKHQVLIVAGETGSGKTTQLPKLCLAAGRGMDGSIGVTQPRRIAAITVGRRIAEEINEKVGQTIGIKIRFQDQTSEATRIKIMTDGILLAEAQTDRFLNQYDTLIVDEAHERSLNIDFILGILKQLLGRRTDLKLIITSATIDTEKFAKAFDNAPVIQVSGRMFPVETRYVELSSTNDEETSHIEMAVQALDQLHQKPVRGDMLVFMPTEQDIRDTCEQVKGRNYMNAEVIPLFARLSASEQQRVFHASKGHKIIVATNVAETSITIPGIRYVIDTGLARICQYTPRSRTNTLPVVAISRSSADQRMGRCGRMADGVCIRLFSQEDYDQRPLYTPPEILRANLAEVILRMIALRLGDVAAFPFIDPPSPQSVQDGYKLLLELGAIEAIEKKGKSSGKFKLTAKGRLMVRLPLDPRLACMLIEAHQRNCLDDVAIIAAALSIQDPRERPIDRQGAADLAHSLFVDPASDFVTLLHIWHRYQSTTANRTSWQQVKQFCRKYFLSFRRMREWRDVYHQIIAQLAEQGIHAKHPAKEPDAPADISDSGYAAIHQSILCGFLSNIAEKREQRIFQAAHNRQVMIFPGSGLFKNPGQWIVAAEMVETSRLFARCAAVIHPDWIEPAAKPQCKYSYSDPHWERKREAVVVIEQVSLFGLIIDRRKRNLGPIDPAGASEIFIRQALINGDIRQRLPFMQHNLDLMAKVSDLEDRLRRRDLLVDEAVLFDFYRERIGNVYDLRTLKKRIARAGNDHFLRLKEEDLLACRPESEALAQFPDAIDAGGMQLPCEYHFEPGENEDGVTVRVPVQAASGISAETFQWLVPGLLEEKIAALIKALPKELRKQLVPVNETVQTIITEMPTQKNASLISALSRFISHRWGIHIPTAAWDEKVLPDHLRMRIAITDAKGRILQAGRESNVLDAARSESPSDLFKKAQKDWEKGPLTSWDFGDLPETVQLLGPGKQRWTAYPALASRADGIFLTTYADAARARSANTKGTMALFIKQLGNDIKFLRKNLALPYSYETGARYFGGRRLLETQLVDRVLAHHLARDIRKEDEFNEAMAELATHGIAGWGRDAHRHLLAILDGYQQVRMTLVDLEKAHLTNHTIQSYLTSLREIQERLVPENFVSLYAIERWQHLPRYLQALAIRAERGVVDLEKERAKSILVAPYEEQLTCLAQSLSPQSSADKRKAVEDFFWMVEEYKISIFAQQIKTLMPVSAKRLDKRLKEIEQL